MMEIERGRHISRERGMCGHIGNLLVGGGGLKQCGKKEAGLNAGKHQYIGRIGYSIRLGTTTE